MYSSKTEYQKASLTILPTEIYNLPFMGHKTPYLSSLLVTCHHSSRLYGVNKAVHFYFCPYSNQSITIKGVFLYFCPYSNQSLPKRVFYSILQLFYPKPYQKGCFFLYFCPYSNKALPKKVFSIFLLKSKPKICHKLYFSLFLLLF